MALWSKTDNDAGKPKYLTDADKANVIGVEVAEAQQATNRAKGLKTPGWNKYTTYTDAQGNTRNKAEVLVAFGGNFLVGDNDAIAPEITISVQPQSISVVEPATATFSVTATRTGTGTLTYQWQKQEGGTGAWADVTGATAASYTTGATTVAADNGDTYRVQVGVAGLNDTVASSAATLTVTAE